MPLKLKIKRRLLARSDRVKSVELHPTEPWMLVALYSGRVYIWNIDTKQNSKTFEVCDLPVRTARFVARKNWVITGSDDTYIRVFNYNTLEQVKQFAAHLDYIRSVAVHPSNPFILTSGDDGIIKLWDWEKKWTCTQVFRGHTYLIMQVIINPKDYNQFATASLDRSVKVWQLGSPVPNFSLKHERDVNCIDYYPGGDKPYIMSGEDGGTVRIWDYQTKSCVQSLQIHSKDVYAIVFHPTLPIILSGSADGTIKIIHSSTYRLENTLNYGLERVWTIGCHRASNNVAIGFDEGSLIIRIGQEEPAISMDSSGKIIWAKHSEIQQANIKAMVDQKIKDGERLSLAVKDMGSCEIYPQTISHSPNGRFVAVCGDGEYIIYTAMALRNKSYGTAQEFVWSQDSSVFAVRDGNTTLRVFKNFKEHKVFKPTFGAEGIYGGHLLGVKSSNNLSFYDWESTKLIQRIEISPKNVAWSDNGRLMCVSSEDSLYVLTYNSEVAEKAPEVSEDGFENAFEVVKDFSETVRTGVWVGDCFIYTNSVNRLNYYVGGEIVTIAHLDREVYILGYIPKDNRLYLSDKEFNIVSYSLLVSVLEYQTAVMRQDFDTADKVLPMVPKQQRTRVAMFLEKQGFKSQALAVTTDVDHKFYLAIQIGDLKTAYSLATQHDSIDKWKQLSELAIKHSEFGLAQECMSRSQDFGGLLLLATSAGHRSAMIKLAQEALDAGQHNIAFLASLMLGRCEECLEILIKTNRLPEAAFFARTYLPSQISRVVTLWKKQTETENKRLSNALADPSLYQNLFPAFADSLKTEQFLTLGSHISLPASAYLITPKPEDRNPVKEMLEAEKTGKFVYIEQMQQIEDDVLEEDVDDGFVKVSSTPPHLMAKQLSIPQSTRKETFSDPKTYPKRSQINTSQDTVNKDLPMTSDPVTGKDNSVKIIEARNFHEDKENQQAATKTATQDLPDNKVVADVEDDIELDLNEYDIDDFDLAVDVNLDVDDILSE